MSLLDRYDKQFTRLLEISPALASWALLTAPVWGAFLWPAGVASFIILFDLYFFYRASHLGINSIRAYRKIQQAAKINWWQKGQDEGLEMPKTHHVIFIPTYKEPMTILKRTLAFLNEQELPTSNISIVLAGERREEDFLQKAKTLKEELGQGFANFWTTQHTLLDGEVAGKSSNLAYAAKDVQPRIHEAGIDTGQLIVTVCDADVAIHPKYLSNLSYQFLGSPYRYQRFWQAALLFYNNIWRVPMPVRVIHTIYSIQQVADLMRPKSNFNYSTYSVSWKLVEQAGFWDTDVIAEDWHLFFKCFFAQKGEVEVDSVFLPLFADAAEGQTYFQSLMTQYSQNRRWAWGVTDISYAFKQFLKHSKEISKTNFLFRFLRVLEQHVLWPVNWWIITLGATLPLLINPAFRYTVYGQNLPKVSGFILTVSTIFILSIIVVDYLLKPPRPVTFKKRLLPLTILQYLLMPVTAFLFGALPGMDAHTRLLLGKRLEYKVTPKQEHSS
jgi:cellulose synthase/poly-beta-1,6-N-acetylglucosamine synthase-like glycosyltransferase